MEMNSTLNGFETVFDVLKPNVGEDKDTKNEDQLGGIDTIESPSDEELEALKNKKSKKVEVEEEEDDIIEEPVKKSKKQTKVEEDGEDDDLLDSDVVDDDNDPSDNHDTEDTNESTVVGGFFDALAEKLGWEATEEDKPQTAEELVEYFYDVIEENSKPQYASEEIERLDEFVKNGGNIRDYFTIDAEVDLDNISIGDSEDNQKTVIREYLREKGLSTKQIDKKISRYEDAGMLEDEAEDALEALREIKEQRKEQLLANQQRAAVEAKKRQQDFFNNVVAEIKGMNSIHGVSIPEKDKKALLDYIFKPDADGQTKYQKDYAKSLKNLITSAYFTMKGDTLLSTAQKQGKNDAIKQFKNSLSKNSGVNKRSKQSMTSETDNTIWSSFTRQLRNL